MRLFCYATMVLVVSLGLSGCYTPPPPKSTTYGNPEEPGMSTSGADMYDYDLVVKKMVESLVKKLKPHAGKPPVITFGPLRNKTPYNIDARQLMSDIRIEILNTGKARFSGATDINRKGGESGQLWKQLKFQKPESGVVDPKTASEFGKVVGADYILYGQVTHQAVSRGGKRQVTYQFNLNLQEVETGLVIWAEKRRIRKNFPSN